MTQGGVNNSPPEEICPEHKDNAAGCRKQPKVHTSFRINPVVEMFSKMKGTKEDMLREIGLHGLRNLPREDKTTNKSFDWRFAFWLLKQLDTENGSLDLGARGCLHMRCEDVELMIGIPCSGPDVKKSNPLVMQNTKKLVKEALLLSPKDDLSLENIAKVLDREITADTDGANRRAFIMAAFIFAVSYFLAPKGRPAKVNNEILEAILDTEELKNLNWASYVLMSLRDASDKVKKELLSKTKSVTLDGCLLLLQVLYLDNLDFGLASTTHEVIPRIKDFTFDKLHELINADKRSIGAAGIQRFGIRQLRPDQESLYTRGDLYRLIILSKQRIAGGLFLDTDKQQILEYVKRNVEEGKRRVRIASRQFEEQASSSLDQCQSNISRLLDVWLEGRVISLGSARGQQINGGNIRERQAGEMEGNDSSVHDGGTRARYKTMSRRPSKVRKLETTTPEAPEEIS